MNALWGEPPRFVAPEVQLAADRAIPPLSSGKASQRPVTAETVARLEACGSHDTAAIARRYVTDGARLPLRWRLMWPLVWLTRWLCDNDPKAKR